MKTVISGGIIVLLVIFLIMAGCVSSGKTGSSQTGQAYVTTAQANTQNGIDSPAIQILGDSVVGKKVYADSTDGTRVDTIRFAIGLADGVSSVDMSKTSMSIIGESWSSSETLRHKPYAKGATPASSEWVITQINSGNINEILEPREIFTIVVKPSKPFGTYEHFILDIKPPIGSELKIQRRIPGSLKAENLLFA